MWHRRLSHRIVPAVVHLVAVALDHVRLSARILYRLGTPAAMGNLSDLHRIGNHALHRSAGDRVHACVTAWLLLDSMVVRPCGYRHRPFVLVRVHLEDAVHDLRLVLIDLNNYQARRPKERRALLVCSCAILKHLRVLPSGRARQAGEFRTPHRGFSSCLSISNASSTRTSAGEDPSSTPATSQARLLPSG